jgi:hypothetical protein
MEKKDMLFLDQIEEGLFLFLLLPPNERACVVVLEKAAGLQHPVFISLCILVVRRAPQAAIRTRLEQRQWLPS